MVENHHHDPEPPPPAPHVRDLRRWQAAVLLFAVITGFYWRLIFTDQFTWMTGPDITNQVLPWFQFQAAEWHRGSLPLWEPNQWGGQPLIGQAQPGVVYPLNWVLFSLPLRDGWIKQIYLHYYFVAIHLLAAWFAYKLARDLGCRRLASVTGASVFALAGWLGATVWPQMINGAVWAPLVFLYLFRAARGRDPIRSSILGGFFLGVAWLSGHHQIPMFTSLAAAGVWLWTLYEKRDRRAVAAFLAFWVIAACAGAVQTLPAQEYGKLAKRWVGINDPIGWDQKVPYDVHRQFSLHPPGLVGILMPGAHEHSDPFIGVTVLCLSILAVALLWRRAEVRILLSVGIGGLLFSLAHHTFFHGLIYALVPNVDKARSASMAVFIFGFAASTLAAFGVHALLDRPVSPWPRRVAIGAAVFGAFVFATRYVLIQATQFPGGTEDRSLMIALAALLLAAVLTGRLAQRTLAFCLLGLFLVEVSNTNSHFQPSTQETERLAQLRALGAHGDIAEFLRNQTGMPRIEVDDNVIAYNFGDWYGLPHSTGYLASITTNVLAHEFHKPQWKRLLGVEFRVANEPTEFHNETIFRGRSGMKVFRHAGVLPRAFIVHQATQIKSRDEAARALSELSDPENRTFLLEKPPALQQCSAPGTAVVRSYSANRVRLSASLGCRGMVVLADTWFPGWYATVDGKDAPIYEAYALVRGVVAEAGNHEIELVYRPRSVLLGAALSIAALLCALAARFYPRRQAV